MVDYSKWDTWAKTITEEGDKISKKETTPTLPPVYGQKEVKAMLQQQGIVDIEKFIKENEKKD